MLKKAALILILVAGLFALPSSMLESATDVSGTRYSETTFNATSREFTVTFSNLPRYVEDEYDLIDCSWYEQEIGSYLSGNNLIAVQVQNTKITAGSQYIDPKKEKLVKATEQKLAVWDPKLFLDGQEIKLTDKAAILLGVDPTNEHYYNNTLEWDYGVCKRQLRIIENSLQARWIFEQDPAGDIRIELKWTGELEPNRGWAVDAGGNHLEVEVAENGDEFILASEFTNAIYPVRVADSPETFYPDADEETSSVDGMVLDYGNDDASWATIITEPGTHAYPSDAINRVTLIYSDHGSNGWLNLYRGIFLFDTAGLPDACTITDAVLSIHGEATCTQDALSITPDVNVYSSAPASNTDLEPGDFDCIGAEALASVIAYGSWDTGGYNDFTLIDVNADGFATNTDGTYIDKEGITKLGTRNANYDVSGTPPSWTEFVGSSLGCYYAEQGEGYKPRLVVTYVTLPTVVTNGATSIEETTATLSANVTSVSGDNVTKRGFEWDTDSGAPYSTNWTENGDWGVCQFTHGATGLTEGELYYCRGMAKNTSGWGYGGEVTFFTKPDEPNSLSATAANSTQIDLTWVKGAGADNTTVRGKDGSYADNISDGYEVYNGTGASASDTGLTCSHTYYYRVWSWASEGGFEHYSDLYAQNNELVPCLPTVSTTANATSILSSGGTISGNITATGGQNADYRGFEWGNACDNYTDNWTEGGSFGVSHFSRGISGLSANTTTFFRVMAHNVAGWGYGSCENFTTSAPTGIPDAPANFTITQVGISSANLSWTKGFDADTTVIRVSTNGYPATVASGYSTYNATGNSTLDTGLSLALQTYYYRTWSYNAFGYSIDYAEGTIGGANMVTIAVTLIVLVLTIIAFWKRDAVLYMLGTIGWLFMTFYLVNQNYPAENAYLPFAMAGFCLSVTLVMTVQTVRTYFGARPKVPTSNDIQSEYKKKVLKLTRRQEQRWWE